MVIQVELEGQLGFGIISSIIKKGEVIMSAAYLIAQLKVTNSENYKEYIEKVPEIIKNMVESISQEVVSIQLLKVRIIIQE